MQNYKYQSIVEWAQQEINDRKLLPGERFYSECELCRMHKVSRETVRKALTVLEDSGILVQKRGSGTFVKEKAERPLNGIKVGVISTYFSDYIFPSIVTGIDSVLKENNLIMQLSITQNKVSEEASILRSMLDQNIGGVIIEPSKSALPNPNTELFKELKHQRIPTVFFNARYPWASFPLTAMNDVQAGRVLTDYLFELGHRKIAGIFSLDDMQGHLRYQGFMDSYEKHIGISSAEDKVLWYSSREYKTLFTISKEKIFDLVRKSTAIVCYNDNVALSLLNFCKTNDIRVPDDLSIVGIDNSKLSSVCEVPLTTVNHPHEELGKSAAEMLIELIRQPDRTVEDRIFDASLITRDSAIWY